jgi:hypothetical protein
MARRKKDRSGYVRLDPVQVEFHRLAKGMSVKDVKDTAVISDETWRRISDGGDIWMDSANSVKEALGVANLLTLLHPSKLVQFSAMSPSVGDTDGLPDWEMETPWSGPVETSNGLKYVVWKLKHRLESNRFARGKRYDLSLLPTKEQDRLRHYLARHGEICNRVAGHPWFPLHVTTVPDPKGDGWWVVDEWIAGRTLAEVLLHGPVDAKRLPEMMRQIAAGLRVLHEAKIIRRELSPRFTILCDPGTSVVLTDFELGKLLDGSPTVSANWPGDPYQAPEIGGRDLTENDTNVDLYSWGRILVHAATWNLPPKGDDAAAADAAPLPPRVRAVLKKCLSPDAEERPQQVDEVIKAMRGWK